MNNKNGNKYTSINKYFKCKWIKCPNEKTYGGRVDNKTRPSPPLVEETLVEETHFRLKDTHRLKVKGQKKILHENGNKQTKSWGSNTYTRQK